LELAAMTEPDLREQLLADYEQHEDRIDKAANVELWGLGDWLVKYVPNGGRGRPPGNGTRGPISLDDLAGHRGRSREWLNNLRKVAEATAIDRLPQITPRVYLEAMRAAKWDLMEANASLVTKGHRLRDQAGPMESVDAIEAQLGKRSPEERADVARKLASDPTVAEIMQGEPLPDFGAAWADKYVIRIGEQAHRLESLIRREGLVFSPNADLPRLLEELDSAERRIAEVRAAVQERVRDARLEELA
jgi:hypothetical protein